MKAFNPCQEISIEQDRKFREQYSEFKRVSLLNKPDEFDYQLTKDSTKINFAALDLFKKYKEEYGCIVVESGGKFALFTRGDKRI